MSVPAQGAPVTAVVPVKHLDAGKSRLALPPEHRRALAGAFVLDVVTALRRCAAVAEVLVVTDDRQLEASLLPLGVRLVPDPGAGLRAAVRAGCAVVRPDHGVLVVPADLPFLSGAALDRLLRRHAQGFVPDRDGSGTTLLLLPPGSEVAPQYGAGSAAAHAALGLRRLEQVASCLRHDVDRVEDLRPGPGERLGQVTGRALGRLCHLDQLVG